MYLFVSFANKTPVLRMFGASNADGINDACQYNNMDMQNSTWDPRYPNASYTFHFLTLQHQGSGRSSWFVRIEFCL